MINDNLINKVKQEIEQWDRSTENKDRPYLVVTYDHNYYCHYFNRGEKWYEFNNGFNVIDFFGFSGQSFLRFLNVTDNISLKWLNEDELRNIRRQTIVRQIDEARKSKENNNLKIIVDELKEDCGKIVSFYNDNVPLLLVCAVSSEEDYYYVGIDKNMKLHYESCVGKYDAIDDKGIIQEMEKWLIDNNNEIKTAIQKALFEGFDVPFTNYSKLFNIT